MKLSPFFPALLGPALALATGLALFGCGKSGAKKALYETAPVKIGDITQIVTASGTLSALVSVDVGSQISGRIQTLNADFNSVVKKAKSSP